MLFAELNLDNSVIHPDRAAICEGEIIGARRQPDVILNRLKDFLGALDAGARWSADVQLDPSSVDARKEVGADEDGQDSRADHHDSGHGRHENPPPQNTLEHPAIEIAEAVEPRIECCEKSVEPAD